MMTFEGAKVLSANEVKEFLLEEDCKNPTVEGLMFIETRAHGDIPGKVFPCYVYAFTEDPDGKLLFRANIIQYRNGEGFGMLEVYLHEDELGVSKRIWDKPPTKGLRNETPFLEEGVQ